MTLYLEGVSILSRFDWDNPFRPEDFLVGIVPYPTADFAAKQANARFKQILEEHGRRIYFPSEDEGWRSDDINHDYPWKKTAYLICEKEIDPNK